jgi:ligand-binding sensor domain-containing protein/signal transduction histidine kinase
LAAAHFLAVISPVSVEAAEPNHPQTTPAPQAYTARAWQIDDGLPNNLVRAITQTPDGYLWVGTRMGLARFDGIHFRRYDPQNTPALKNPNISALCVDANGFLWIGTYGEGLLHMEPSGFSGYTSTNGLVGDEVTVLYRATNGSIWIGTTAGLSHYEAGKFTNYTKKDGLASDIVRSVLQARDGNIWVATGEGLNRITAGRIESFTTRNGLPDNSVRALWQDLDGRLWIGSNKGLVCYQDGKFCSYSSESGLGDTFVNALCRDWQGNFWVGTYSGLNRFDGHRFTNEPDSEGAAYDLVTVLFEDREGNIWVGSREGLARLTPRRFFTYSRQKGLSHNNIMSVLEDHAGRMWLGTWGGGLNELSNETVTVHSTQNGFPHDLILSLCEDTEGNIWAGADFGGGLTRWKDGTITHYGQANGLSNEPIHVLHADRAGNLWLGTSSGLVCFRNGTFTNLSGHAPFPHRAVRALLEDHAGNLWIGTEDGLWRLNQDGLKDFTAQGGLTNSAVLVLYEDAEHQLWLGTDDRGLIRFRNGSFTRYTTRDGLAHDLVLGILEDDYGYFWLSSLRGISRVSKKELDALDRKELKSVHAAFYGKADGLLSAQCNGVAQPAAWKSRDGRFWFPTTKGVVAVDSRVQLNEIPPPVVIEEIVLDKRPLELAPARTRPDKPLRLLRGRGELEVHYTGLSLQAPEKNKFKYRLDGVDPDWVDADTRRTAYYSHLHFGQYRFHVAACNNDGIWSIDEATVVLQLQPLFWETPWFIMLSAVTGLGGLAAGVRYISVKRIRRKLAVLQQAHAVEKERARIARDIHDDLGARLTQITLLSAESEEPREMRDNLRKISSTSCELAQSLDEIVWAVNPQNDTLEALVEYLSQTADDFLEDTPIRSHISGPAELPARAIPAETRHQLFLAFKEALNNAARHARASELWIEFRTDPAWFRVSVADNGSGFDNSVSRPNGNGLKNMRERMESIGGSFALQTAPGKGTRVELLIPLEPSPHS